MCERGLIIIDCFYNFFTFPQDFTNESTCTTSTSPGEGIIDGNRTEIVFSDQTTSRLKRKIGAGKN